MGSCAYQTTDSFQPRAWFLNIHILKKKKTLKGKNIFHKKMSFHATLADDSLLLGLYDDGFKCWKQKYNFMVQLKRHKYLK